jgi:hypothetical protein
MYASLDSLSGNATRKQSKAKQTDKLSRHAYTLPCLMKGGSYDAVDTRAVLGYKVVHGSAEDTPANGFGNTVCLVVHNTSVCRQPECANQAVFHDESGLGQVSLET